MRSTLTVLGCLLVACGSDDGASFAPVRWEGTWVATEMGGLPLPRCVTMPEPRCVDSVVLELDREGTGRRVESYRDGAGVGNSLTSTLRWTKQSELADKTGVVLEISDDRGCTYGAQTDDVPAEGLFMSLKNGGESCYDELTSVAVFRRPEPPL